MYCIVKIFELKAFINRAVIVYQRMNQSLGTGIYHFYSQATDKARLDRRELVGFRPANNRRTCIYREPIKYIISGSDPRHEILAVEIQRVKKKKNGTGTSRAMQLTA